MEGPYEIRRLPSGSWSVSGPGRGSVWKEQSHALMAAEACNAAYAAERARLAPVVEAATEVVKWAESDDVCGCCGNLASAHASLCPVPILRKSLAEWKEGGK